MAVSKQIPHDYPEVGIPGFDLLKVIVGGPRSKIREGGKVLLPSSVLEILLAERLDFPLQFMLMNPTTGTSTHCGVQEFVADEGTIHVPPWVASHLGASEDDWLMVTSVVLPKGTFVRFKPRSIDFLDITDPKAVMEYSLRQFSCLTKKDVISIDYNDKVYELEVEEVRPSRAVSIIWCDLAVDFSPPKGRHKTSEVKEEEVAGAGSIELEPRRLDGKPLRSDQKKEVALNPRPRTTLRGIPDYSYEIGTIQLFRGPDIPPTDE